MSRKKHFDIVREAPPIASEMKSPERIIEETLASARENAQRRLDEVTRHAREHPQEALLYALGTGYALRMLPTVRILGALARLALRLIKPGLLIYGVSKLWYMTQKNGAESHQDGSGQSRE